MDDNEVIFDAEVCGSDNYELGNDFQALTLETGNPSQVQGSENFQLKLEILLEGLGLETNNKNPIYRLENTLDCSRSLKPLARNESNHSIWSVKFSPSGQSIASGGEGKILLWNAAGKLETELLCGHDFPVAEVDWSRDGSLLVSGGKELILWNLVNGSEKIFNGHELPVMSAKLSRDNGFILSGSDDGTAKIWNAETGQCIETVFRSSNTSVTNVDFHPDGTRFMVTSYNGYCRMYDLNSMKVVEDLTDEGRHVIAAKISPDSRHILFSRRDYSLGLYDMRMQKVVGLYKTYYSDVAWGSNFSLTTSGKYIVSGTLDGFVYIWDVTTQRIVEVLAGHSGEVECVDCHPENDTIISGDRCNTVKIWKSQN